MYCMYKVYILTFCFTIILSDQYSTYKDKNRDILIILSMIFFIMHYEYVNVRNLNLALSMKLLLLCNCSSLENYQKPYKESSQ